MATGQNGSMGIVQLHEETEHKSEIGNVTTQCHRVEEKIA